MTRNRIIPIFVPHFGCPHQCVFCNQRHITGEHGEMTGELAALLLKSGLERSGPGAEAAFYGGSFTAIPEARQLALLEAAQPFLRSGELRAIRISTRPDAIDPETVSRLRRFGVRTVELGAQSMSEDVLRASGRGHSAEDVRASARLLKEAGFSVILQMMTGLPRSTAETERYTANELIALHPDGVRIYPTVVVPDSPLAELYRQGAYRPQTVEEAVALCAELFPLFLKAGIPVLRIGLQPTPELDRTAIAGAYHPALGELVKSRVLQLRAAEAIARSEGSAVLLGVNRRQLPLLYGQKRTGYLKLCAQFPEKTLRIVPDDGEAWEIRLQSG